MLFRSWPSWSVFLLLGLSACAAPPPPPTPEATKPKVVATTPILCEMTEAIAQQTLDLTCLMDSRRDPHTYEPTPSDRKALESAQLILYGGYNLEPKVEKLLAASSTPKVAVYEKAVPEPLMGKPHDHDHSEESSEEAHDHSEESSEESIPDPHVWHNAENGVKIAQVVTDQLSALVPDSRPQYEENRQTIARELSQIHTWIQAQIATIPPQQRKLVTTHEAFAYYSQAYGIPSVAVQGVSADSKTTPQRVKTVVETIQKAGVPTVFIESTTNPGVLDAIAQEAQIQVAPQPLYHTGALNPEGQGPIPSYTTLLIQNTRTIVEGLKGQYQEPNF